MDQAQSDTAHQDDKIADDLIKAQFTQLVEAIKSTRERIHQITVSAIVGLPATIFLAKAFQESSLGIAANIIVIVSPFIIASFAMFYVSERAALKRYGRYIAVFIDPLMTTSARPNFRGWSTAIKADPAFRKMISDTEDYDACKTTGMTLLVSVYLATALLASGTTIGALLGHGEEWKCLVVSVAEGFLLFLAWRNRYWMQAKLDKFHA